LGPERQAVEFILSQSQLEGCKTGVKMAQRIHKDASVSLVWVYFSLGASFQDGNQRQLCS
jgi:hypothetical protein